MQATVIHEDQMTRKLAVEIPYEEMMPYFNESLQLYREEAQIEGFRKGKAPKDVVLKRFGNLIESEAVEAVVEDFYKEALDQTNTEAIAVGKIENMDYKKQQPLKFEVTVEIMPKYTLTKYNKLKIEKEIHTITDEEIKQTLDRLRDNQATTKDASVVESGNYVTCDIQELDENGTPILGKSFKDRRMPLTTQFVGQDMIDGLAGAKQGEARKLNVQKRPTKEGEDPLSIERVHYDITVRKIEEIQKPALDDDFAKDLGFDTLVLLREDIEKNLKTQWEKESDTKFSEHLIDEIIKENDIPAPEPLVDAQLQRIGRMMAQRFNMKDIDGNWLSERYRPTAIREVKWMLAKRKLVEMEDLKVSEEDFQIYRETTAKANNMKPEEIKLDFKNETEAKNFEDYLVEEKAVRWIRDHAVVTEVPEKEAAHEHGHEHKH